MKNTPRAKRLRATKALKPQIKALESEVKSLKEYTKLLESPEYVSLDQLGSFRGAVLDRVRNPSTYVLSKEVYSNLLKLVGYRQYVEYPQVGSISRLYDIPIRVDKNIIGWYLKYE